MDLDKIFPTISNRPLSFVIADQSVMTDDNYEKSTQTPRGSNQARGRRSPSRSESESESGSESESESSSQSESEAGRLSNEGSVVVVSMNKSGGPTVRQTTRSRGSSPREPTARLSRESSPREPPSSARLRSGRGYVPVERSSPVRSSEYAPKPPSGRKIK